MGQVSELINISDCSSLLILLMECNLTFGMAEYPAHLDGLFAECPKKMSV